jgi:hypothetical protein
MRCNVELRYQLSSCSRTAKPHGTPWSILSKWYLKMQYIPHRKHRASITKTNWFVLRKIIAVPSDNHRKSTNTLRDQNTKFPNIHGSMRWRSWLRHCATSQKVAGSIPDGVSGISNWHNPTGRTTALRSNQPLTEISTRGKGGRCVGLTLPPSCADCLEIWEPQPPGTLRACPGLYRDCITFVFYLLYITYTHTVALTRLVLVYSFCRTPQFCSINVSNGVFLLQNTTVLLD